MFCAIVLPYLHAPAVPAPAHAGLREKVVAILKDAAVGETYLPWATDRILALLPPTASVPPAGATGDGELRWIPCEEAMPTKAEFGEIGQVIWAFKSEADEMMVRAEPWWTIWKRPVAWARIPAYSIRAPHKGDV